MTTSAGVNVTVNAGLPAPWADQDVGAAGLVGSASYASGTFTVKASGADIAGGADAFHFVYQPISGDATIVARVATLPYHERVVEGRRDDPRNAGGERDQRVHDDHAGQRRVASSGV